MYNNLIVVEPRINSGSDDPLHDIPLTWEELFANNKAILENIVLCVEPINIPRPFDVFEAYHLTPLPRVRVVIIGQDPYPGISNSTKAPFARGLSFSYSKSDGVSPSMRNIISEIKSCYPDTIINHTSLVSWAYQGVFLLNSALTLNKVGNTNTNIDLNKWKNFISETIRKILNVNPSCIFVSWDGKAFDVLKNFKILNLLASGHPSPLNTGKNTKFLGCKHFKKINEILEKKGEYPIDWNLL